MNLIKRQPQWNFKSFQFHRPRNRIQSQVPAKQHHSVLPVILPRIRTILPQLRVERQSTYLPIRWITLWRSLSIAKAKLFQARITLNSTSREWWLSLRALVINPMKCNTCKTSHRTTIRISCHYNIPRAPSARKIQMFSWVWCMILNNQCSQARSGIWTLQTPKKKGHSSRSRNISPRSSSATI